MRFNGAVITSALCKATYAMIVCLAPAAALSQQAKQPVVASSQWLLAYAGKSPSEVVESSRFQQLLRRGLPHYAASFDTHPLPELVADDLSGAYWNDPLSTVTVESGRFVSITNTVREEAEEKVLLWCDTAKEPPELIYVLAFEGLGNNGLTGSATLEIYTKRPEGASSLPPQFIASVRALMQKANIGTIDRITLYDAQDHRANLSPGVLNPAP